MVPDLAAGKEASKGGRRDAAKDRPHHEDKGNGCERGKPGCEHHRERGRTEGEGDVHELDLLEDDRRVGNKVAQDNSDSHRKQDPKSEQLVEKLQTLELEGCGCEAGQWLTRWREGETNAARTEWGWV